MFDLDRFVADLRASLAERSRGAMKEIVARAIADPDSLLHRIGEPGKAGIRVLHRAPDLTVLNAIWAPNQFAQPHNHRMSAVIGMYSGREDNMFWRRVSDRDIPKIEVAGGQALGTGDVTILGRDIIHSVVNPLAKLSGAIHVYDGDLFGMDRSMWNPETLVEQPYDIGILVATPVEGAG